MSGDFPELLKAQPGTFMTAAQCQRATSIAIVLALVKGRSVPIQIVERLAVWVYSGARDD